MENKKEITVEFPPYCIMDGSDMALVKIAGHQGIGNVNGCLGCGIYDCFGNKRYDTPLKDGQKEQINTWIAYIHSKKE